MTRPDPFEAQHRRWGGKPDPAKTLVMAYIGSLVASGQAHREVLANGDIWLRFHTGETFLLADSDITRL